MKTAEYTEEHRELDRSTVGLHRPQAIALVGEWFEERSLIGCDVTIDLTNFGATGSSFIDGLIHDLLVSRHAHSVTFIGSRHRVSQYIAGSAQRFDVADRVSLVNV
jgi:hypothetical protein